MSKKSRKTKSDNAEDETPQLPQVLRDIMDNPQRRMGRPTDYTPEAGETVIRLMSEGLSLTAAAGAMGHARSTVHNWMKRHADFMDSVMRAKATRVFKLEVDMLHTESGAIVNARRFALINADPEEWREKQTVDHEVDFESPLAKLARELAGTALKARENLF